jgi:redox-sensitive bicupin YhaK (pirin superfamily)
MRGRDVTIRPSPSPEPMHDIYRTAVPVRDLLVTLSAMTTTALLPTSSPTSRATSSPRTVEAVHASTTFHWVGNGFHVSTYFPSEELPAERTSPFVLMDYGPAKEFTSTTTGKRGVGWHPHRGFETVTLAWEGAIAHRDNAGHAGVIGPGDVQWMTAASGIFHEEFHETEFMRKGGPLHMMQLWVNLPKADKMAPPGYQGITAAQIPSVPVTGGGAARVIAGELDGARGPAHTFTGITMLDANLKAGARLSVPLPASYNAMVVVAKGSVHAGSAKASTGHLVLFANDGGRVELVADEDSHVILLSGEPLGEPVVQYGPFVMNTVDEIERAFLDVRTGRFGPIPD